MEKYLFSNKTDHLSISHNRISEMLWPSDLLLVVCGIFVFVFFCKRINLQWRIQPCYKQIVTYLTNVLNNSKKDMAQSETTRLLTHLNNYSQKMQSWYEQIETSTDTVTDNGTSGSSSSSSSGDEDEDEADSGIFSQKGFKTVENLNDEADEGMRAIGIQTDNNASTFAVLDAPKQRDFQNSWRSNRNQFYSSAGNNDHEKSCDLRTIRWIQQEQLKTLLKQVKFLGERDLRAPLIICVEANSSNISGYLINLRKKVCKFYVFGTQHLPWKLETPAGDRDSTEFKMKNVLFALLLWEQEILWMKKFSLFANCWAVNHPDCRHGRIATDFLEHFTSCENVIRVNSNPYVSRFRDTSVFAKLIQPARELMCWNLSRFRNYIKNAYGIEDFDGSHSFMDNFHSSAKDDGYHHKTFRYDYFLTKVNNNAEKWENEGCRKCDLKFLYRMELKPNRVSESLEDGDNSDNSDDSAIMPYPLTDNNW